MAGPNDLSFDPNGNLWVADTDHRRIVELLPLPGGEWETGRSHSAMNDFTLGKRFYPMMLTLGQDGNWWVTQASEFLGDRADLLVYGFDQGAIAQIDLPGSILATDVASMGADIIVTDMESFQLFRINAHSHEVSTFGSEEFIGELASLESQKQRMKWISGAAMAAVIVFGVLMIVAAVIATPKDKRWTPPPGLIDLSTGSGTIPQVKGIHWLARNEKLDRQLKLLPWVLSILIGFAVVCLAVAYFWIRSQAGADPNVELQDSINQFGMVMLISVPGLVIVVLIVSHSLKAMKIQLGSDGKQLHIRLTDGRRLTVSPADLSYSKRAIYYRQHTLPIHGSKNQNLYESGEVENWIIPLLNQSKKLSEWEALKHQWKHTDFLLLWVMLVGIAGGGALIMLLR